MVVLAIIAAVALIATHQPPEPPAPVPAPRTVERVLLLPDARGQAGAVVVRTPQGGELVLDQPWAVADVTSAGTVVAGREDPARVRERYAAALAARPAAPVSFTVYFITGRDELTAESLRRFDEVKAELARRPAPEIVAIGHTDRVGTMESNDVLSRKRAEAVKSALVAAGIAAERIDIAGRGEREPAVPTADEVEEPRNRRVEISVR